MTTSQRSMLTCFLSLVLVFGLTACEQDGPAEKAGAEIDQAAERLDERADDARDSLEGRFERAGDFLGEASITGQIKAQIMLDSSIEVSQLNIDTTNGVVKLSGTVDSQQSIDRIQAIVTGIDGVISVENNLAIRAD